MSDKEFKMKFHGLWGFSTVVHSTPEGKYKAALDADERGVIEGDDCDSLRAALAAVLRKAAEEYERE